MKGTPKVTNGSGGNTNKLNTQKNKVDPPKPDVLALEPQSMNLVFRSLVHFQTTAIILEHAAEYIATAFRGNDAKGPTKLLLMPNGTKCRAEVGDVLAAERVLHELADDARKRQRKIEAAGVLVADELLFREEPRGPRAPVPKDEGAVVDVPTKLVMKPVASNQSPTTTKGW